MDSYTSALQEDVSMFNDRAHPPRRDWRNRDSQLMPPRTSTKRDSASAVETFESDDDDELFLPLVRRRAPWSARGLGTKVAEAKVTNPLRTTDPGNIATTGNLKRERDTEDEDEEKKPPKKRTMARRLCLVCDRERGINQFPAKRRVSSHNHDNDVCRTCFNTHIENVMDNSLGGEIPCPQCDESTLNPHEIKSIIHSSSVDKYELFSIRGALRGEGELQYCLSPTCKYSQLHVGGEAQPIFNCHGCKQKYCLECKVPWHEDESCTARKERIRLEEETKAIEERTQERLRGEEAASQEQLKKVSKPCPKCKANLDKWVGCDHVTCNAGTCRHQFCWRCAVDWATVVGRNGGNHMHKNDCPHYRPLPGPSTQHLAVNEATYGIQAMDEARERGQPRQEGVQQRLARHRQMILNAQRRWD